MLIPPQAGLRFCACPALARRLQKSDGGSAFALLNSLIFIIMDVKSRLLAGFLSVITYF